MASPTHSSQLRRAGYPRRYRRSSFNGAKQLNAAQAPSRRIIILISVLAVALLAAIGTIAFHLAGSK